MTSLDPIKPSEEFLAARAILSNASKALIAVERWKN
jgi:hypothetical protein